MFDGVEIKGLRQDVDALTEQISMLQETLEVRHMEVLAKFDRIEEMIGLIAEQEVTQDDIEDIKSTVAHTNNEISDIAETILSIDAHLVQKESKS